MTSTVQTGKQSTATKRLAEDPRNHRARIQVCLSQTLQEVTMAGCPRLWRCHRNSGYHDTGVILPASPFQLPLQPKTPGLCKLSFGRWGGIWSKPAQVDGWKPYSRGFHPAPPGTCWRKLPLLRPGFWFNFSAAWCQGARHPGDSTKQQMWEPGTL